MTDFWDDVFSASGASGACNTLQQNSYGYTSIHVDIKHSKEVAPLPPLPPHGADPQNADDSSQINYLAENLPHGVDYDNLERQAIQEEAGLPPFSDPTGTAGVPGFAGMPDLTAAQHGAILHRLMNPAQEPPATAKSYSFNTPPAPMPPRASVALPERVTCASCAEFTPGREPNSLGQCSRTANGLPPIASRGYGACFPHAPRTCPDHTEP